MMVLNEKQSNVISILCDCCGKSCKVDEFIVDNINRSDHGEKLFAFEYLQLRASWGYHSNKDGEVWSAHLCEKCVDEKLTFIDFKIDHIKLLFKNDLQCAWSYISDSCQTCGVDSVEYVIKGCKKD